MYFLNFLKKINRKTNIPVIIYIILNFLLIWFILQLGINSIWISFLSSIVLYIFSLCIALSSFGEWILRKSLRCKEIKRKDQKEKIGPLFLRVYKQAKEKDSSLPDDIKIFINNDKSVNAFATGRKTICATEGLLYLPDKQIEATLAHEFGHLSHKDTDLIPLISIGNIFINVIVALLYFITKIISGFMGLLSLAFGGSESLIGLLSTKFASFMINVFIAGFMGIWDWIGILLVKKSSRSNEFEADHFSSDLGYGNDLCAMLDRYGDAKPKELFAALANSHPSKDKRISNLQKLGATYQNTYSNSFNNI